MRLDRRRFLGFSVVVAGVPWLGSGRAVAASPAVLDLIEIELGNVFPTPHHPVLGERVRDVSGTGGSYSADLVVRDGDGAVVWEVSTPVTLGPGETVTRNVIIPESRYGYYAAVVELHSGAATLQTVGATLAVVPPVPAKALSDSPWGIGGGGAWLGLRFDEAGADERFRLTHEAGIGYSREELFWDNLEPSSGQWRFDRFDAAFRSARRHGVLILGLLDYWASWSVPDGYDGKSTRISWDTAVGQYAEFCSQMVQRYRPGGDVAGQERWHDDYGIRHWELWNEPPTFWSGTAEQFGWLVRAGAAAIKAADPDATVVVSTGGASFDRQVIEVAGIDAYDALAIHLYPGPVGPEAGGFAEQIATTRGFLDSHGGGDVAIWITETGWNVDGGVSAWDQANFIVRANLLAVAAGVQRSLIFTLVYGGDGWGILDDALEPRISYAAYASLTHLFAGLLPKQQEPMGAALRAYVYSGSGGTVAAVWSVAESGALKLGRNDLALRVLDLMGNPVTGPVPLTGRPHFLVSPRDCAPQLGALIRTGTVTGIAPLQLDIANFSALPATLPPLSVTVTNRINVAATGTATVTLPAGWQVARESLPYGPLAPGESMTLQFQLTRFVANADNAYPVTVSAGGCTATRTLFITAVVRGTPPIDGTTHGFLGGAPVHVDQGSQVTGIPDWTPQNCSAVAWSLWDDDNFYFAVSVADDVFAQPYTGSEVWNGDSVQLMFDPENVRSGKPPSAQEYALAQTSAGPQIYQFAGPQTGQVSDAPLVCARGAGGDIVYTVAIPLRTLAINPAAGTAFGMDFLVNDNDGAGRLGWISWTPGIGNAWDSAQFSTWTMVESLDQAAFTVGPGDSTLDLTTVDGTGRARLDNRGLSGVRLRINGGPELSMSGSGPRDVSPHLRRGRNAVTITAAGDRDASGVLIIG